MIACQNADPICALTILLVEDEPGDRELMSIAMTRDDQRCALSTVADGGDALRLMRQQTPFERSTRPDLVILDLNLPGMSGRDVLREMKTDEFIKGIPVVVLSTSSDHRDISVAYELGASSYIVKPGNFRDFNAIIKCLLDYWLGVVIVPERV